MFSDLLERPLDDRSTFARDDLKDRMPDSCGLEPSNTGSGSCVPCRSSDLSSVQVLAWEVGFVTSSLLLVQPPPSPDVGAKVDRMPEGAKKSGVASP